MKKYFLPLILLVLTCTGRAQGTFEALTDPVAGQTSGTVFGTGGWRFQALQSVTITDLGCLASVLDAEGETLRVGLWTDSGVLLRWRSLTNVVVVGNSRYASIDPYALNQGDYYRVGIASEQPGGSINMSVVDEVLGDGVTTLASVFQLGALAAGTPDWVFPANLGDTGTMFLGPNFLWRNIPEPSALGLLAFGFVAVAMRKARGR